MKMTNFEAFCRGFWSVWDFTRPFSEKPVLYTDEELAAKYERLREELGLNESVWDSVGGYLRKAMLEDIENYERKL